MEPGARLHSLTTKSPRHLALRFFPLAPFLQHADAEDVGSCRCCPSIFPSLCFYVYSVPVDRCVLGAVLNNRQGLLESGGTLIVPVDSYGSPVAVQTERQAHTPYLLLSQRKSGILLLETNTAMA